MNDVIREMIEGALSERASRSKRDKPSILPEAQIAELREVQKRYVPCRFREGDLVTPVGNASLKSVGVPHIVLQVLPKPVQFFELNDPNNIGYASYGAKLDMRVACFIDEDTVAAHWAESWMYERYTEE